MLRIHVEEQGDSATIRLEGKLVGDWVEELERCFERELSHGGKRTLTIELEAVSFIDEPGESLLREMHRAGATLRAKGALSSYLVEQIQKRHADSP
ncbi:MAG: STAS domain-containing protein [Acidobacteriia bacterium]|nr:STAS domain-containing protein [Terriglobia bacterium]